MNQFGNSNSNPNTELLSNQDVAALTALRRDLHSNPELSLHESRTAGIVAKYLRDCGLEVSERIGGWGVVATRRGQNSKRAIALRADMDALAIQEISDQPHASKIRGVMHACGHDGHTTMLLGAARALSLIHDLPQDVHFIFQPAEEQHGGARRMMADGLFERFPCDAIYGLHIEPDLPLGHFATRYGPMMAAAAVLRVTMRGAGGHGGADPHRAADLTLAQAEFITGLQSVIRRGIAPTEPIVLTIGHVSGGAFEAPNVMPDLMRLAGTIRCFDPGLCDIVSRRLQDFGRHIAMLHGCEIDVDIDWEASPLVNSAEHVDIAIAAARSVAGAAAVTTDIALSMGAEDFADMLSAKPGAYMIMGNAGEATATRAPLHTACCDFNDEAIPLGIAYWVALASARRS